MATYIDFKALRSRLDFAQVLVCYGVTDSHVRLEQLSAPCPLPTHRKTGSSRSFSADLSRGIWRCFGCKTSGNVLDFAMRMEGKDPKDGVAAREVALKLQRTFIDAQSQHAPELDAPNEEHSPKESILVNAPLNFELKGLDLEHESLATLGIGRDALQHFGLGYCKRGFLKERIAIPLHDPNGRLIGYAGRRCAVEGDNTVPLYLFPTERRQHGTIVRFALERFVYGVHWIGATPRRKLFVTDDVSLVWHMWECGIPAVSILSDQIGSEQFEVLRHVVQGSGIVFVGSSLHKAGL